MDSSPPSSSIQHSHRLCFSNASREEPASTPTSGTAGSRDVDTEGTLDLTNKELVKKYMNAYFDSLEYKDWPILHRATTTIDWQQGVLDPNLTRIICASGIRALCLHYNMERSLEVAHQWAQEAQAHVLQRFEHLRVSDLQVLILVIRLRFTVSPTQGIWVLLSLVARMVFTKGLNYEIPSDDPIRQECLRRLMWAVYDLDKIYCGGIEDLTLCPTHRMHIRLPNNDSGFQRGLRSRSQFLGETRDHGDAFMDTLAYRMKLLDIRDRILRYTRRVVLDNSSPADSQDELRDLDCDLSRFRASLPEDLQENQTRLMLMHQTGGFRSYVLLHTMLHLCRCDLYRFLIPRIREAVSQEAFARTPQAYIDLCQLECLQSAASLCGLWAKVHQLDPGGLFAHPTLVIAIYQCAKIVQRLHMLLPTRGNPSLRNLKESLGEAVEMVLPIQHTHRWMAPCINDLQRLIPRLGTRNKGSETPPDPSTQDHRGRVHRRSKYAMGADDAEQSADVAASASNIADQELSGSVIITEDISQSNPPVLVGRAVVDVPTEHPDMLMFLDPFNIQLNPYFDLDVEPTIPTGFA
ncbi:DNA mismatch repair protein msh-2 [Paramyrothecium foliicola]|nr:DNA mismatch repair protein msh-2 [Paramyrothecium foliicola]